MSKKLLSFSAAIVLIFGLLIAPTVFAKAETQAVSSPKCDAKKLKKIGGNAIVKIEKGGWEGGFNITLETDKMKFNDLLGKMAKAGCF